MAEIRNYKLAGTPYIYINYLILLVINKPKETYRMSLNPINNSVTKVDGNVKQPDMLERALD